MRVCVRACVCVYLEVGELRVIEVRVDVQRGPHHQERLKLVQRGADVTREAQTPDLQHGLQVKEHSEGHLVGATIIKKSSALQHT